MPRLIDADVLKEKTISHGEKIVYVVSFIWDIDASPTIDAIPVEWLKEYQLENQRQGNYDMVGAIEVMMWDWEKEQEAR